VTLTEEISVWLDTKIISAELFEDPECGGAVAMHIYVIASVNSQNSSGLPDLLALFSLLLPAPETIAAEMGN
jgi:hypothetical protein